MSDVKMSKWFKLPVSCMLQLNGGSPHTSQDSISFDGVNVMTGHHVEKVVVAINSYDSNQELIAKLKKQRSDISKCYHDENADNNLLRGYVELLREKIKLIERIALTSPVDKAIFAVVKESLAATKD